mmetsp:Transcript_15256/g.44093  ORF Transcript_15256/g.44093 Transcript_15256/m.44093 type:complete len:156 (+) Transcript_15256:504-971(+)
MTLDKTAILVHPPNTRKSEPLNVLIQTTCNLTKWPRQHWNCSVHQVHSSASPLRLKINMRVWLHKVRNIGNMNPELDLTIGQLLYMKGIIKILGGGRIDGEYPLLAIVSAPSIHFRCGFPSRLFSVAIFPRSYHLLTLFEHRTWKFTMINLIFNQ